MLENLEKLSKLKLKLLLIAGSHHVAGNLFGFYFIFSKSVKKEFLKIRVFQNQQKRVVHKTVVLLYPVNSCLIFLAIWLLWAANTLLMSFKLLYSSFLIFSV